MNDASENADSLKENISAISASFHSDRRYEEFYSRFGERLDGFPGIWNYCVRLAEAFGRAEQALHIDWDGEWIQAIDDYVDGVYRVAFEQDLILSHSSLEQFATDSVLRSFASARMRE